MLNEQTLATLNTLRLFGMAKSFTDKISHPNTADLSHQEFFGLIVQDEKTYRENLRLKRLLHNAKLKQQAALEDIDYKHPRGLNCRVPQIWNNFFRLISQSLWPSLVKYTAAGVRYPKLMCSLS